MDVVITVLLDLQQKSNFREALGGKSLQQWAVLLKKGGKLKGRVVEKSLKFTQGAGGRFLTEDRKKFRIFSDSLNLLPFRMCLGK